MSAFTKFITRANTDGIRSVPFIDYLDFTQKDLLGGAAPNIPMANTIMPGYDQEMDIDDSGRITFRNYLQELRDMAGEGITSVADKSMSLFDNTPRANFTRAGLGALLFGINPLTAILGAAIGSKGPDIVSGFQQSKFNPIEFVREKRAEREAAREAAARAEFDRLNAIRQQRDADSMSGGPGETTHGTFGSSVNDPSTFSDYS